MKKSILYCFLINLFSSCTVINAEVAAAASSQKTYETHISRRERNLDHWDAETLAAYMGLDPDTAEPLSESEQRYVGIDASIMFYAQWCKNCHSFAPVWDTIGQLVQSGTTQSNLILALFNCELNEQNTRLCNAAGVTHYPTLMFVGAGSYADTDPISSFVMGGKDKAAGPFGATKLKRTVKFQGNLNIGDSVLDWVRAMQGLSRFHRWGNMEGGWLKTIRSMFINPFDKRNKKDNVKKNALPVGVPPSMGNIYSSDSGGEEGTKKSPYVVQKELKEADEKVSTLTEELEHQKFATDHAGHIIESFLFPSMTNHSIEGQEETPMDVFTKLDESKGWDAKYSSDKDEVKLSLESDESLLMKECVIGMTLDYCTRLSKKTTTDYLESLSELSQDDYPSFSEMETALRAIIKLNEPYCSSFDECFTGDFKDKKCRPATCPLQNDMGCRYVASCLSGSILEEYKDALEFRLTSAKETIDEKEKEESQTKAGPGAYV